jgi:(1->4)-alpha-D-glucan 1-alpha-D-glucosylmutase
VDFTERKAALASLTETTPWPALAATWPDGRIKFALTHRLLELRQELPSLFTDGAYHPVEVRGRDQDEVLAFARTGDGDAVIVVVGRHFARSTNGGRQWPAASAWQATIGLDGFSSVRNALGAPKTLAGSELSVAGLFEALPVAILQAAWHPPRKRRASPKPVLERRLEPVAALGESQ